MTHRGSALRTTIVALALAIALPAVAADQAKSAAGQAQAAAPADRQPTLRLRSLTNHDRELAAARARQRAGKPLKPAHRRLLEANPLPKADVPARPQGGRGGTSKLGSAPAAILDLALGQIGVADLYNAPNFANSPLPTATCICQPGACDPAYTPVGGTCVKDADCTGMPSGETCTGPVVSGGIKKFVNTLAPLCALGKNDINQCLPIATPDTAKFPGADYYEIGVKDYTAQFHRDLPATTQVRGYYQKNNVAGGLDPNGDAATPHYLGPVIIAQRGRPVRVLMTNEVGTGAAGKLFIPVDPSVVGAGKGPLTAAGAPCNPLDPLQVGNCASYSENRATFHLHGGNTPWISDGTQHQWTAPAGEATPFKKGLVTRDVPDMPTADGQMSFYWTNDQSGRLMFYHDHAYGITRLNVYAGEAAGYVLVDPVEENALATAGVPGTLGTALDVAHYMPLVIQDKTFVPTTAELAVEDPTWDPAKWGSYGNFWFPHVYPPNQWPNAPDFSGANPFGRWDYGPWFHPAQSSLTVGQLEVDCATTAPGVPGGVTKCPGIPNPTIVPESFLDTPMVNGTVYPTMTVDPTAYRFQILNAAQERNWNLSLFVADATGTEVPMVDAVPHSSTSVVKPCSISQNANLSAVTGLPVGPDKPGINCYPATWPTDGRAGGVPDPMAAGPMIYQIGSEGGLLPAGVKIPPTPVGFEYNRRNIVVLNVAGKSLFMGPAERADIVVDFSAYAGKTLILYNDAPAPVPAFDTRYDYYTGDADQTDSGGAPTTQPGYGPNTRTIMQIVVRPTGATAAFNQAGASAALKTLFTTQQAPPVVPEAAYSGMYPAGTLTNNYFTAQGTSATVTPIDTVTAANPAGTPQVFTFGQKAIQELFDVDYGRMNATLGVEMPLTNFLNQTTVPYANFDPATEFLEDTKPQIWKITHNGVDTHTIHFHLLNLQIVNRVGWDGAMRAPDANELGWKESIRMHPLEEIYVALKPVKMASLPWPLPDMWRPLDVTLPLGTTTQFTGVDITNLPITVQNQVQNYGWEYVWHCHLLGHEENDMLRAEIFVTAPEVPAALVASATGTLASATAAVSWKDTSASAMSYTLQRSTDNFATVQNTATVAQVGANGGTVTYTDTIAPFVPGTSYQYRVQAAKAISSIAIPATIQGSTSLPYTATSAWSATATLAASPGISVAPATLAFGNVNVGATRALGATVTNTGLANLVVSGVTIGGTNAALFTQTNTCGAAVAPGATCTVTVTFAPTAAIAAATATLAIASNVAATPTVNVPLTGTGVAGPPAAPSGLTARVAMNPVSVTLNWINNAPSATGFTVQRATNTGFTAGLQTFNVAGGATTTYTDTAVTRGTTYYYRVRAVAGAQNSAYTTPGLQVIVSIRFIQVRAATPQTPQTVVTAAFANAQAAGNLNVVVVGRFDTTSTVTSVTDSAGNAYNLVGTVSGNGFTQSLYYASNVKAGANTVTVRFGTAATFPDVRILEYTSVGALDVYRGNTGTTNVSTSLAVTTTAANELVFGANTVANTTTGPGTGFTSRIITTPNADIAEDRIVTTTGNYTATANLNAAQAWVMQVATFK